LVEICRGRIHNGQPRVTLAVARFFINDYAALQYRMLQRRGDMWEARFSASISLPIISLPYGDGMRPGLRGSCARGETRWSDTSGRVK
jgi:hypothetical protein